MSVGEELIREKRGVAEPKDTNLNEIFGINFDLWYTTIFEVWPHFTFFTRWPQDYI